MVEVDIGKRLAQPLAFLTDGAAHRVFLGRPKAFENRQLYAARQVAKPMEQVTDHRRIPLPPPAARSSSDRCSLSCLRAATPASTSRRRQSRAPAAPSNAVRRPVSHKNT